MVLLDFIGQYGEEFRQLYFELVQLMNFQNHLPQHTVPI